MTFGQDAAPQTANDWLRANVRELMDLRRWTQMELAKRLGVSQPWLSKRLTGTTPFQIEDIDAIGAVFGLSPQELLCAGFGKWDRRDGEERRAGHERRRRPHAPFHQTGIPLKYRDGKEVGCDSFSQAVCSAY
jgi:transcriptional regulator with XRE-family HTH domain